MKKNHQQIKEIVKQKYAKIARKNTNSFKSSSCCSPVSQDPSLCCSSTVSELKMIGNEYQAINGHVPQADLGLGCGIPTEFADIRHGQTVLDLGSGAGNDVFIARRYVGERGRVIGIDMTEQMIKKANMNKSKLGYSNVEFRLADIENLPVDDNSIDVAVSNCVINLVPNKEKVYSEIYRVLKPGGHFCISDIVTKGEIPASLKKSAELYTGCIAGAADMYQIAGMIARIGFKEFIINSEKEIVLEDDLLKNFLTADELTRFRKNTIGFYSVTMTAYK